MTKKKLAPSDVARAPLVEKPREYATFVRYRGSDGKGIDQVGGFFASLTEATAAAARCDHPDIVELLVMQVLRRGTSERVVSWK